MALIKLGGMIAEIRGSVGGATFARNRGGAYVRNRSIPINPASVNQTRVRQLLAQLTELWTSALSEAQRESWRTYAANVPLINSLGEPREATGLNHYVRSNSLLLDTGGSRVDNAPTAFTVGPSFTPTISIDPATDTLDVTDLGGFTPSTDGTIGFLISMGPPQSPGVNFFRSPFRKIDGTQIADEGTDLPTGVSLVFPIEPGQSVFIRTTQVTTDGRVGVPVVQRFLAA